MKAKQYNVIIILFILLIGVMLFTKYYQTKEVLKGSLIKLTETEIKLNSVIWSIHQSYKYSNKNLRNIILTIDKQKRPISSILNDEHKLFYKFSLSDCHNCIESELKRIQKRAKEIYILIETSNLRDFNAFIEINNIDKNKVFQIENYILEEAEEPFYFVTNNKQYIKEICFPVQSFPQLSTEFYNSIQNKYFN